VGGRRRARRRARPPRGRSSHARGDRPNARRQQVADKEHLDDRRALARARQRLAGRKAAGVVAVAAVAAGQRAQRVACGRRRSARAAGVKRAARQPARARARGRDRGARRRTRARLDDADVLGRLLQHGVVQRRAVLLQVL
jgi:hypothetical protein